MGQGFRVLVVPLPPAPLLGQLRNPPVLGVRPQDVVKTGDLQPPTDVHSPSGLQVVPQELASPRYLVQLPST